MAAPTVAAIGYEAFRTAVLTTVVTEQFMSEKRPGTAHGRWAEFRFGVVGSLLSAQPPRGELEHALQQLAAQDWTHPITGEPTRFHISTIAR